MAERKTSEKPKATTATLAAAKRETYSKKSILKSRQYNRNTKDAHGAMKTKVIEEVTYKNGVVKERIKGILKNGRVIYDNGIENLKEAIAGK